MAMPVNEIAANQRFFSGLAGPCLLDFSISGRKRHGFFTTWPSDSSSSPFLPLALCHLNPLEPRISTVI